LPEHPDNPATDPDHPYTTITRFNSEMSPDMTRLILIRHGASLHMQRSIIVGESNCPGLSDEGFQQAALLARRLRTMPELTDCQTILSSPVLRAYQTAEVLAHTLAINLIVDDPDLVEIHPGEAEGLTHDDYRSRFGEFDLPTQPTRPFAPGGENWLQFTARVHATMHRLAETYADQTVLVVTHAGFIVASLLTLFDIPRSGFGRVARFELDNTSLTEWQISAGVWTLAKYNDTTHLAEVGK
jgi:broad specificity phosphatase PhoE